MKQNDMTEAYKVMGRERDKLVKQRDELLKALREMFLDPDGKEWSESGMSDNEWDVQVGKAKAKAAPSLQEWKVSDMKPKWERDKAFPDDEPVWYLLYEHGYYVVGKSPGGDWYCGWNPETDPAITDETFQYFDSWQAARKYCESLTCHTLGE